MPFSLWRSYVIIIWVLCYCSFSNCYIQCNNEQFCVGFAGFNNTCYLCNNVTSPSLDFLIPCEHKDKFQLWRDHVMTLPVYGMLRNPVSMVWLGQARPRLAHSWPKVVLPSLAFIAWALLGQMLQRQAGQNHLGPRGQAWPSLAKPGTGLGLWSLPSSAMHGIFIGQAWAKSQPRWPCLLGSRLDYKVSDF